MIILISPDRLELKTNQKCPYIPDFVNYLVQLVKIYIYRYSHLEFYILNEHIKTNPSHN